MKTKTQFTNRILSLVLSIMMVVSMLPASALSAFAADGTPVAKVGEVEYTDFATAVANWTDNTTLTLLADVTDLAEQIELSGNGLVLDLNGKKLEATVDRAIKITAGELTIRDSAGAGSFTTTQYGVLWLYGGNVNFESGTLESVTISKGTFNMTGGTIQAEAFTGIYVNGDEGTANISGGEIKVTDDNYMGIYNGFGTLNVSGNVVITSTYGYAFQNYSASVLTTISGDVALNGSTGELYLGKAIVLNTQPTGDTTWRVSINGDNPVIENGVFAIPGDGVTLDPAKFTSLIDGYEVKLNNKNELVLCNHSAATVAVSNGNETHNTTCDCNGTTFESNIACSGGVATATHLAVCAYCGGTYGELDANVNYDIIATAMTAAELKDAVTAWLADGNTDISILLTAYADQEMFTAIWTAFSESTAADGSINLTISGAKTVPEYGFFDNDNYFENGDKNIAGDKLKSLTLTDVVTIGDCAFSACTYLESVNLPQVVTVGFSAFNQFKKGTKLTSLNLPNATTIGDWAFAYSSLLTSVNLPKVVTIGTVAFSDCDLRTLDLPEATTIGSEAFMNNDNLVSCSAPKATTIGYHSWGSNGTSKLERLELTAVGDFTLSNNIIAYTPTEQIDLVLNKDKETQVTQNEDGTATWVTTIPYGDSLTYTFKSITLACVDGTTNHSYTYTDQENGTHKAECTVEGCGFYKYEAHTPDAEGYTDNKNGTHSLTCTVCQTAVTEAHTLTDGACNACDYVCPHSNFDSATGNCTDCETSLAIAKVEIGGNTTYYQTAYELSTAIENNSADQAITLLANFEVIRDLCFYAGEAKNTLDLNGHTLTGSSRIDVEYGELTIAGTGSINIFMSADSEGSKIVVGSGVTLNDTLRSVYGGVLDLTNATIPEAGLNVILYPDELTSATYNVSDVLKLPADYYFFVAGKAAYTYSGETEGTVLKHTDHSYTYTDNGDGTHDATCSVCGKMVDNEAHTLTYTANGNTIAAACSANCGYSGTATISATGKTYDGNAVEVVVSKTGSLENMIIPVTLTKDSEAFTGEPVNAGAYTASVTLGDKTVSVNFTIAKAEVSITTAPTPNTLTYIGEAQYLISAGEAVGGTMVYSLTENGEYTTSIPQGTNAGDYTVWYYVQGDANHNDSAKDYVSVTIEKATPTAEDFIFTAPTDLIYDGTAKPATITVKDDIVGMGEVNVIYFRDASMWIDNEREPIYPGRYKVGIWIKEGDNYKAVYSDERIWLGDEFEIKYLTTDAKADISGTMGSNGWYTSDVTLSAPEGYQISKTKYNDGFVSELTFSAEQNETITYYLKDANGDVAEKTVELKIDKTAPAAQYQIGTDGWKQFINTITFGLFCKDYKTVDIEYTDALSGVAEKQYYISSEEITNTSRIAWLDYTDTLSLNATGKYLIYMRVVDNAGNEVILNTEGIVIYEDSVQVTESVSATYNAGTDKAVTVKLNGNTVNAIQNGNAVLTAGTDYTVSADGTITLKASYLDALKAGEYTFTVSYNPQGVETDMVNMTTTFTVKVEKADGKVSNLNISSKTYDGTAVTVPTFDKLGDGAATIEYKVRGADDSTYTTTAPKDAGNYVVRVTVAESTNYKAASATTYFAIANAELRDVSVQQNGKLTYNGQAQTPTVSTSVTTVDGSKVTFTYSTETEGPYSTEIPSFTNVGWAHTVFYRATADNHNTYYGSFHVEIEKATVTEPTIASKPYNGSAQTADISGTDLYTVEKNNGGTEKGSYDVVLKLKDGANYKWSTTNNAEVTLQFVISAAQNAWDTNPSISGWTYGEAAKTPVGTAKYGAVKVVYTGKANDGTDYNSETAPTKAGNYTATFTVTGTEDYSGLSEQVNFTIAKKAVTVTANDTSKTYGESDPALTYTHTELVGSDALVITVARTSGENANTYTITASQAEGANPNYEITFKTGTFTIHKATLTVTVEDKTATYGDPVPTYTVKYEGFKSGDDKDDLGGALAFECGYAQFSDKGEYTIKASGYTSGNYTISYVDGKLTVNAKPITVTIQNATSVYGDTFAELKATDNGIVNGDTNVYSLASTATGTSNVGKYTITGTALDSNYDVTFVNGEYEITKREITITVDAKNTVVNTTLPTYTYKVEGLVGVDTLVTEPTLTCNANIALIGEYDITASGADAGGNYSIKYVPAKLTVLTDNAVDAAAGYTEELKDYDPATVTSEDKAELEEMLSEINTILADETTTDNGKKALEEVKEQVEKLIKEITDAAEATDTENTVKVENVTPENVTPENKNDLEGAKADLEKALEDNGGNYTEDEKKAIEEEIKRIDDALEVIGNVEAVEEVISKLPAVDTVKPDDEEAIKAITDAQTAYNALSDYEKSLVDEATKAALDKLAAALVAYDIVEGDGSSWTEDSDHNITFVVNGLFGKFVGIKVDDKDVDKANYEVKAGSTIITLKASYLDTLAVGEHTITVVYTDGSTDGAFNVHAKANSPATGDNSNMFLWIALLFISGGAVITLTVVERKKRMASKR